MVTMKKPCLCPLPQLLRYAPKVLVGGQLVGVKRESRSRLWPDACFRGNRYVSVPCAQPKGVP